MSFRLSGFRAWMWQRFSAVYLLLFIIYVLAVFSLQPPHSHAELVAWLGSLPVWIACLLFVPALLLHAWIGVRDVILDYVPSAAGRLLALAMVLISLSVFAAWALVILVFFL